MFDPHLGTSGSVSQHSQDVPTATSHLVLSHPQWDLWVSTTPSSPLSPLLTFHPSGPGRVSRSGATPLPWPRPRLETGWDWHKLLQTIHNNNNNNNNNSRLNNNNISVCQSRGFYQGKMPPEFPAPVWWLSCSDVRRLSVVAGVSYYHSTTNSPPSSSKAQLNNQQWDI